LQFYKIITSANTHDTEACSIYLQLTLSIYIHNLILKFYSKLNVEFKIFMFPWVSTAVLTLCPVQVMKLLWDFLY